MGSFIVLGFVHLVPGSPTCSTWSGICYVSSEECYELCFWPVSGFSTFSFWLPHFLSLLLFFLVYWYLHFHDLSQIHYHFLNIHLVSQLFSTCFINFSADFWKLRCTCFSRLLWHFGSAAIFSALYFFDTTLCAMPRFGYNFSFMYCFLLLFHWEGLLFLGHIL